MDAAAAISVRVQEAWRASPEPGGLDAALVASWPKKAPVRVVAEALTEDALTAIGASHDVSALRGVVQALTDAGHPVTLVVPLLPAAADRRAFVDALYALARLDLRAYGLLEVELTVRPSGTPVTDPWVARALDAGVVGSDARHTGALTRLFEVWRDALAHGDDPAHDAHALEELEVRLLDDGARRMVFEALMESWRESAPGWPHGPLTKHEAVEMAESLLGERERWIKAFRQATYDAVRRMVLIPTWQCELRCAYCFIPKQDGRVMPIETARRAIDMLMSTSHDEVVLQFFGGEAILEWARVQDAIAFGAERAAARGKTISFVISSNGWSLDADKLAWLAQYDVRLELSLDGKRETQERFRSAQWSDKSSYDHSIVPHRQAIFESGIPHWVIMVVHPTDVDQMPENFFHIADLGFKRIQINNMLGRVWKPHELQSFARGLHTIGMGLRERWARGETVEFINMNHRPLAMRLNGEVSIDHDGTVYGGNQFLHETEHKDQFAIAHLDDLTNVDRYWIDATDNNFLLDWSYKPKITQNNIEVGKVMASFIKWMKKEGFGADGPLRLDEGASRSGEAKG